MLFFLNETATTDIYTYLHTLSLHDALPISPTSTGLKNVHQCPVLNHTSGRTAETSEDQGNPGWHVSNRGECLRAGDKRLNPNLPIINPHCRSEERRVGKECVSKGRSRWSTYL